MELLISEHAARWMWGMGFLEVDSKRPIEIRAAALLAELERRNRLRELTDANFPESAFAPGYVDCAWCGAAPNAPELDHIVPLAAGGHHVESNVQCACARCNRGKSARPMGQLLIDFGGQGLEV